MGHLSDSALNHLKCIDKSNKMQKHVCDIYPISKLQGFSFPASSSRSKCIFELVHIDTWGPYHESSLS